VISSFAPRQRYDDLFDLVSSVCDELKTLLQVEEFACVRADKIASAGIIHPEIWQQIKHADVIVADVSGQNPNVMLEVGVAGAWRKKDQVIILREDNPEEKHAFDINPARHIEYDRTAAGFSFLKAKLREAMFEALAAAPFEEIPSDKCTLPLKVDFDSGKDCPGLWVPSTSHRRMLPDCLEFGSLYFFLRSWLSIGDIKLRNVRVRAVLRFTQRRETPTDQCWMGIALRAQLPWANWEHLALVRSNGRVTHTARKSEDPNTHYDVELGTITNYDPSAPTAFEVSFDDQEWTMRVGTVESSVPAAALGHVFSSGRILIQTYFCRVGIQSLEVTPL